MHHPTEQTTLLWPHQSKPFLSAVMTMKLVWSCGKIYYLQFNTRFATKHIKWTMIGTHISKLMHFEKLQNEKQHTMRSRHVWHKLSTRQYWWHCHLRQSILIVFDLCDHFNFATFPNATDFMYRYQCFVNFGILGANEVSYQSYQNSPHDHTNFIVLMWIWSELW